MVAKENSKISAAAAEEAGSNPYHADALDRVSRLRAMIADLPGTTDLPRLRTSDIRLANGTSAEALEQAAVMSINARGVGGDLANAPALRDAVNYIFAYQQFREEMTAALRQLDLALVHKKLVAVKLARPLYQVMKAYAASEVGDSLKPYVKQMQRALGLRRRKPATPTPSDPEEVTRQQ
jgi:hypothetical protein